MAVKRCYYDVLGVDKKCESKDIKKAHRKLALKYHPDKNPDNEEAHEMFLVIQEAYETLIDPQDRAWYDDHRNQIMKGEDVNPNVVDPAGVVIFRYFGRSAFARFDDHPDGFYSVYRDVFERILKAEKEFKDPAANRDQNLPGFGTGKSSTADVIKFYKSWDSFFSIRSFAHVDKWDPKDYSSELRRIVIKENKEERIKAKKEWQGQVQHLVKYLRRLDPRYIDVIAKRAMAKKIEQEKKKEEEERIRVKAANLLIESRRLEREKQIREKQRLRDEGFEISSDDDQDDKKKGTVAQFNCRVCSKPFKKETQYLQHLGTKKHKQNQAKAEAQKKETEEEDIGAGPAGVAYYSDEDDLGPVGVPYRSESQIEEKEEKEEIEEKVEDKMMDNSDSEESSEDVDPAVLRTSNVFTMAFGSSDDSEDSESSIPIFFGNRSQPANKKPPTANLSEESENEQSSDDEDDKEELTKDLMSLLNNQKSTNQSHNEKANRRKERKKKKNEKDLKKEEAKKNNGDDGRTKDGELLCKTCKLRFDTRNKLFTHIKSNCKPAYK